MVYPRKMKTVKLTLPATPSQVHLARSFVEWFAYHGMRPGIRGTLVNRKWTDGMIDEFINNFRHKHGLNRQTAMLQYDDKGDSDNELIELEGGWKMVIRRRIVSPDEATIQEEDLDSGQHQELMGERVNRWDRRPGRNPRRQNLRKTFKTRGGANTIGDRPRPGRHGVDTIATQTATATSTNSTTGASDTANATNARESQAATNPRA